MDGFLAGGTIFLIFLALIGMMIIGHFIPLGLWVQAVSSGVYVGLTRLFALRLRRVNPARIVHPLITAHKADLPLSVEQLEAHHLAGGNVERVVQALIAAQKAGINLTFQQATAIDLAGRNVLEDVQTSVNPNATSTRRLAA